MVGLDIWDLSTHDVHVATRCSPRVEGANVIAGTLDGLNKCIPFIVLVLKLVRIQAEVVDRRNTHTCTKGICIVGEEAADIHASIQAADICAGEEDVGILRRTRALESRYSTKAVTGRGVVVG